MKRKIAILMAIVLVVTALCCACGKDPGETQTSDTTTTTVPQETLKANEIFEKLRIVMEVNKTIVENPVYCFVGSDIGQIEFTCNGSNFVFRGAQSIDYSDIHGITAPVNVNEMRMLEKGGTKYIYITLMDGGRIVEWSRYPGKEYAMNCTLYTPSALSDEELQNVIDTAIKN